MPNWTTNTLIIAVPEAAAADLREALSGPRDWVYPVDAFSAFERPKIEMSHHEQLGIEARAEELVTAFRAHYADIWPAWMKPGFLDLALFSRDPDHRRKEMGEDAAFSVAKLAPWRDKADFDRFFPESDDSKPWWGGDDTTAQIIGLRHDRIGVKWPPGAVETDEHTIEKDTGNIVRMEIRYDTPWDRIAGLPDLLMPVLERFGAKALLVWIEEQGYCGYEHIDPKAGICTDHAFDGADAFRKEDEDEEDLQLFDHEALWDTVSGAISDPDLT